MERRMNKKIRAILGLGLVGLSLAGCSQGGQDGQKEIGIIQYGEHQALNDAREGFVEGLEEAGFKDGETIHIDYQNAQADQSNLNSIAQNMKGRKDLTFAIATPAAQAALNADKQTPILFTAVTDAVSANLVKSLDQPGTNASGTSDIAPVEKAVDLLLTIDPSIKTVGMPYNSSEVNSEIQFKAFKDYAESKGLKVEAQTVTATNEVQSAITALAKRVDGICLPTDNTIAQTIPTIGSVVREAKVPTIGAESAHLEGCLATYGVNYKDLGRQTAEMAVKILKDGADVSQIPVEKAKDYELVVNEAMAKELGIDPAQIKKGE
ncbi:ABC transporter substrate-binding protein [Aerococcus sp. HMSC062A02]|nr:ABC transporter substrate-binding protein [Aerococcus sp. HMSC062A02]